MANTKYLTERDYKLIGFHRKGFTNEQIALKLGLSVRTVERLGLDLCKKVKAKNLKNLVAISYEKNLVLETD